MAWYKYRQKYSYGTDKNWKFIELGATEVKIAKQEIFNCGVNFVYLRDIFRAYFVIDGAFKKVFKSYIKKIDKK